MLIDDAKRIFFGTTEIERSYLGSTLVWQKPPLLLKSSNVLSDSGFTVGGQVTRDMASMTKATPDARYAGTGTLTSVRSYWEDWRDDVFDQWGFFYIYDPATNTSLSPVLQNINQANGIIATETFSFNSRTFTIKHGYSVQGIYKFDVSVNDKLPFVLGTDGNIGSDLGTVNTNLEYGFTKGSSILKLHYNRNAQSGSSSEIFYTYMVPYEANLNQSVRPFVVSRIADDLAIYSNPVKYGITMYVSKINDVKEWIVNDLQTV
jgi:hypothetical protein